MTPAAALVDTEICGLSADSRQVGPGFIKVTFQSGYLPLELGCLILGERQLFLQVGGDLFTLSKRVLGLCESALGTGLVAAGLRKQEGQHSNYYYREAGRQNEHYA